MYISVPNNNFVGTYVTYILRFFQGFKTKTIYLPWIYRQQIYQTSNYTIKIYFILLLQHYSLILYEIINSFVNMY